MDSIFKVTISILSVIVIIMTGISIIASSVGVVAANDYFNEVCTAISESNYSEAVISECITEAQENGYTLTVTVVGDEKANTKKYAEVEMTYEYQMPMFFLNKTKTKIKLI